MGSSGRARPLRGAVATMRRSPLALRPTAFTAPILVAIDIQREYTTPGRPFFIPDAEQSLANCRRILDYARLRRWVVAHVRHVQEGPVFNDANEYAAFVDGFEPLPGEPVFEKSQLSCLGSPGFEGLMTAARDAGNQVYVIGYCGQTSCLATLVGLCDLGIQATYVIDASLSRPGTRGSGAEMHANLAEILANYADIVETFDVITERVLRAV